jgi:hypothetical protein
MQLYDFLQPRWYHSYPATLVVDGMTPINSLKTMLIFWREAPPIKGFAYTHSNSAQFSLIRGIKRPIRLLPNESPAGGVCATLSSIVS